MIQISLRLATYAGMRVIKGAVELKCAVPVCVEPVQEYQFPIGYRLKGSGIRIRKDHLFLSVSQAVTDEKDEIVGVLCGDIQLEEILKHTDDLEAEEKNSSEQM